ncbi:hypothetical protein LOTGIDRAFT_211040 [Lottia gigantea]|uniref:Long-chain-fatty-acid--CoA ligase n=1 Tax=Lottia gigantea TaxID=225164 RepID=V3ZNN7_LOTGI|nr:hypothetical protein LOTGIDRAFT_211040 [Lottia gigantea]ESO84095.1 hypothetical protein LOTGIDRAFT_211040 [Lottia gigantea]
MDSIQKILSESDTSKVIGGAAVTLTTVGALTYYMMSKPQPIKLALDLNNQSVEVEPGVRISAYLTKDSELMEYLYEDSKTLYESFQRGIRVSDNGNCLGSRSSPNKEYQWLSYKQVYEQALNIGAGLINLGLKPGQETFIGIYSSNRKEWTITEQGCNTYSLVTVPLYDTLGSSACHYIINHTNITTLICDKCSKAELILQDTKNIKCLKHMIVIEKITDKVKELAKQGNIHLHQFTDIQENGKSHPVDPVLPKPDDLATICYTSGTTGDPKGVMLTHKNLVSNISAIIAHVKSNFEITPNDVHLSYLPLAHMFERGMQLLLFMHGAQIGFFQGDIKLLTDDLQALRPTIFPTVPRLLNRMHQKVLNGVKNSKLKSCLLNWGLQSKSKEIQSGIIRRTSIWDKILFSKIQNLLGGRIKMIITGSAPLSEEVLNFARCAFGCIVVEGYGQTEATAGITFNIPGETVPGHCGGPLMCNKVKLIDVPEMDYYASKGSGEILAKGHNIFQGYYKEPEKTADTIDKDGWVHTGDIGTWLPNGCLKIVDRKKNIFKLAQGEYIASEKIENIYQRSPYVTQVFLEGNSLKSCVMAVVVLDEEYMSQWSNNNNNNNMTDEDIKQVVLKDMIRCGKEAQLKGFEQVKDIYIHSEQFSVENGLLTPTFKNKRPALHKQFKKEIEELYNKLDD